MVEALRFDRSLPVAAKGRNSVGWWGVTCLIATEGSLFGYLLFSYFYIAAQQGPGWLPERHPSLALAGPNTLVLVCSSVAAAWGEAGLKRNDHRRHLIGLGVAILLGLGFLLVQAFEWRSKAFGLASGSYGSLYFTITGFHMAHVIAGLGLLTAIFTWSAAGYFGARRHESVTIASAYWHFVDVVWLAVFATFYLSPYLLVSP